MKRLRYLTRVIILKLKNWSNLKKLNKLKLITPNKLRLIKLIKFSSNNRPRIAIIHCSLTIRKRLRTRKKSKTK
jgi:hypothetical protein